MTATECTGHKHLNKCSCGKPLIWIEKYNIEIHDDGSFCEKEVQLVPPTITGDQALVILLTERAFTEANIRRNQPKKAGRKR